MKVVLDPPWEYHPGDEERPATQLPFDQAEAFCKWLSQSARGVFRLPSTSEWQWAACGPKSFKYPWGDEWRVGASNSNNDRNSSAKVGSFPVDLSWCGAQDMAGNVTEWCSADSKDRKAAIRGGSWTSPPASSIVFDEKPAVPTGRPEFVGFRVVLEVTP